MYKAYNINIDGDKCNKNNKLRKKVSKYKDKHGNIKKELEACIEWANSLQNEVWIFNKCYKELIEYFSQTNKRKIKEVKSNRYITSKLNCIINKNRYKLDKQGKERESTVYSKENVYEFLLILFEAVKKHKIAEFLDVPDVFYITRQIKNIGVEFYLLE